jgi:hypothetical protein
MEMKEKLYKEKVSENKTTEIHYKMHEIKPIYWFFALIYYILPHPTRRYGYGFYRRKLGLEMTPLPSSRVPLLLETTKNTKPACSVAKIRGRTAFWLLIGCSGTLCKSNFREISIDRLLFRSIDFGKSLDQSNFKFDRSTFQDLRISSHFLMKFSIPLLLSYRNRKYKN